MEQTPTKRAPTKQAASATQTVANWLGRFSAALASGDAATASACFETTSYWRDLAAFTWNIETCEGPGEIRRMLDAQLADTAPTNWTTLGDATERDGMSEAFIAFETRLGRGQGYVRIRDGRCFTLLTALRELRGFEEPLGRHRALGTVHAATRNRRSWLEDRAAEAQTLGVTRQPYVLVVGGGQAGLALGARLRQLAVPTLIVDRHARTGDQWRSRYKSLTLHDPVWYDHMPYLPFPQNWPVFTPKDKLADWLESYAKIMELNVWNATECVSAAYDAAAHRWDVLLRRDGREVRLQPAQLVFAIGNVGKPAMPDMPGADSFEGEQYHSSRHPGGEGLEGKRVVVVGSNNSSHDICADLWENGADVTMIQRSSTHVLRSATLTELGLLGPYSEEAVESGITTEKADLLTASIPLRLLGDLQKPVVERLAEHDAAFYETLEKAGFMHDFGEDGTGAYLKALRQGGGYYIDVGASELLANGSIKLRANAGIRRVEPQGVVLTTGETIPADIIIYATGFGSMEHWAADIVGREVIDRIGKTWGYGSNTSRDPGPWEGELRNMWKPTAQEGLWFHGGNLALSRNYSLTLALQLKARFEALPTRIFKVDRSGMTKEAGAPGRPARLPGAPSHKAMESV